MGKYKARAITHFLVNLIFCIVVLIIFMKWQLSKDNSMASLFKIWVIAQIGVLELVAVAVGETAIVLIEKLLNSSDSVKSSAIMLFFYEE
jgi:hypothetical protein